MKLTALLLLAACLQVSATGYTQQITFSMRNATVEKVLREIERQTGYTFWYNNELLQNTEKVSIRLQDASLEDALKKCFENQPLGYTIVDRTIVLSPAPLPPSEIKGRITTSTGDPIAGVSVQIKGTRKGVTTNANGEFTIESTRDNILVFSYVGYETQEIRVGDQKA